MGRFYQTAKPEFVDDFIYQPPWELIQQNNMLEAQGYKDFLTTATLAGTPDINYIEDEVEKQKVKEIQDEYNNRSTELANKMKQSGNDWKKYLPEMNKLKRDLESDYKTGRIHNIQTSAANYAKMEKQLSTIKDPTIKEAKKRQLIQQWQKNPNRSIDSIFQSGEVYDRKNLVSDFLEQQKLANPEIYSKAFAYADGKGYLHNGVEEVKFRNDTSDALNSYLQLPENLSYLTQMDKDLGLEKYFEEDGKTLIPLTDPRSTAYHMNKYTVNIGDFKQESKKKDIGADSTYSHKQDLAWDKYKFAMSNKPDSDVIATPSKEANFKTLEQLDKLNKVYSDKMYELSNKIGVVNISRADGRLTPKDIRNRLKQLESSAKTTREKNNVRQLYKQFSEVSKLYDNGYRDASYSSIASHYGVKAAKNAQSQMLSYEKDPRKFYSVPGFIEVKGKSYKGTFYDLLENPQKFGLKESDVYDISTDSKTGKTTREQKLNDNINEYYIQGSSLPLVMPGEGNWEYNDMIQEFEVNGIPIKAQYSFKDLGIIPIRN